MTWLKGFSQVIDNDFRLRLFFNEDPPTVDLKEYLPLLPKRKLLILTARNTHTHWVCFSLQISWTSAKLQSAGCSFKGIASAQWTFP